MVLAYLLARRGVDVTLLEAHADFDRDFRGDTIHPSTLELLDQLGLSEPLHRLPHGKVYGPTLQTATGDFSPIDLRRLKTKFPYVMLLPQHRLLELLAEEARKLPSFRLLMSARATGLIREGGAVRGVRWHDGSGERELRASLVVGADGRASMIRHLAGFEPVKTSSAMDILWFRLPHLPGDEGLDRVLGGFGGGRMLVVFDRPEHWQIAYVFPKGHYKLLQAAGLDEFRRGIAELEPQFTKHAQTLTDWRQCSLLSVESSRCPRWHEPGLLLIGDAAHVMSPIGGVGINYAVQDAVAAANILGAPLLAGGPTDADLRRVQRRREWPVRVIQRLQAAIQSGVIAPALRGQAKLRVPWFVRLLFRVPWLRDVPARLLAYGVRPERVEFV